MVRDVRERGRDIEGCIKQWFTFVKPNFHKYVEPQRDRAGQYVTTVLCHLLTILTDIIIPRGTENKVAIGEMPCRGIT